MQVSHQILDGIELTQPAYPSFPHRLDGGFVRDERGERKGLFSRHSGQEQTHGIGHRQTHCCQYDCGLFLDGTIDASLHQLICSHLRTSPSLVNDIIVHEELVVQ